MPDVHKILKLDYLMLPLILALAFYIAFIPHHNYPYPLHVDEWIHLTLSNALMDAGDISFSGSFLLEAGFHTFWGVFQRISGISWMVIFTYFPGIVFIITVLSVYVLACREGFGWEAALFTSLIPTTVGMLGPAFLVPLAIGLPFIPLSLFVVFNFRTGWAYLTLFIFTCFLLSIHAPSAIGLVIILAPYILFNLKGNFKHSLGVTLALAIPFLVPFPWIFSLLLPTVRSLLEPQPLPADIELPQIIPGYGYIPVLFCLLGVFLLAIRGGKKSYSLIFGLLVMLVMLVAYYTFHYGVEIIYFRGLTYAMLLMSIVAGAGLMGVRNLPERLTSWLKIPLIRKNVGNILCLALIALMLAITVPARWDTLYYHMIDKEDYQAFVWVRDNAGNEYEKAVLDPWKAAAFKAITGKDVYAWIHVHHTPRDDEAYAFLRNGSKDTNFLRANGISIVYSLGIVDNPDLVEVREDVYLLKESGEGD